MDKPVKRRSMWVAIVVLVLVSNVVWNIDYFQDHLVWRQLRPTLTEEQVADITAVFPKSVSLSAEERKQFLELVRQAKFDSSNRAKRGPTPSQVLTLTHRDGTKLSLGFWGGERFELSPTHLDAKSQFLIKDAALGKWVTTRFP